MKTKLVKNQESQSSTSPSERTNLGYPGETMFALLAGDQVLSEPTAPPQSSTSPSEPTTAQLTTQIIKYLALDLERDLWISAKKMGLQNNLDTRERMLKIAMGSFVRFGNNRSRSHKETIAMYESAKPKERVLAMALRSLGLSRQGGEPPLFELSALCSGYTFLGQIISPEDAEKAALSINATKAAEARHSQPGGYREKRRQVCEFWATGKYSSRDECARIAGAEIGLSFSTARKALRGTPKP